MTWLQLKTLAFVAETGVHYFIRQGSGILSLKISLFSIKIWYLLSMFSQSVGDVTVKVVYFERLPFRAHALRQFSVGPIDFR